MKGILLMVLLVMIGVGCNCQKHTVSQANGVLHQESVVSESHPPMRIAYEANTRGFYQKITIQNQQVFISTDREGTVVPVSKKISEADWKTITALFSEIDLESLAHLKGPSEKRFYDGAAIAHLEITYKEKEYPTPNFDHGFPPESLKKLVTKIVSLTADKNDN
jgi:hypothetical protein